MRRIPVILVLAAVILPSCTDHHVTLAYRLEEGRRLRYSLRLVADVTRTLGDETRVQRIEATFRASQEIEEREADGGVRARTTLDPVGLSVDGEALQVGAGQAFVVTLGSDGRVRAVERVEGETSEPLALVGIDRLLPRLRPVLPGRPVTPGDAWRSDTRLVDEQGSFSLESESRLAGLDVLDGTPAAFVRTVYRSPVEREEDFPNATARLVGRDLGTQEAWFALDGYLIRADGDSIGRYDVTFLPPGGDPELAPVEGRLVVRLRTEMRLVR